MVMFFFALHAAGRSLGLDAWLRRNVAAVRDVGNHRVAPSEIECVLKS